jgi:ligand-binding SRPBCC domain-containing protein
MKVHQLQRRQFLPHPVAHVFSFFAVPENLQRITPASLGFVVLTPSPIEMKPGTLIEYTIKVLGVPLRWKTLIASYDPPHSFVDEQLRGPYASWIHTHHFEATEGGTMMVDDVRYALPLGLLGEIVHWIFVRRMVNEIFDYRMAVIPELVEESLR